MTGHPCQLYSDIVTPSASAAISYVQRIVYWHGGEVSVADSASGGVSLIMRWPQEGAEARKGVATL